MQKTNPDDVLGRVKAELETGGEAAGSQPEFAAHRNVEPHPIKLSKRSAQNTSVPRAELQRAERERRKGGSGRHPIKYLDTRQAAEYLGLSVSYLNQCRHFGKGPPFYKVGRAIRYEASELDRWMVERRISNNNECRN